MGHAERLRRIPRVDEVVARAELESVRARLGRQRITALARAELARIRERVLAGEEPPAADAAASQVLGAAERLLRARVSRVINASGVVLHTNLGRAPLSDRAVEALCDTSAHYCSIEIDLESGRRGLRGAFSEHALASLTGASDALVVNNNAAAVLLALASLGSGRAVLVSRGELVEIGGGFRVPEVIACSGARLVEVGTTNRTRVADYERALDAEPDAAAILRVHQGNFRQVGFVERPSLAQLSSLARRRGITLVKDLGGGAVVDPERFGLPGEPTVQLAVEQGADLVCFSTDKLLGGPQGGAVVGRSELVERLRRHPFARAVRIGRLPMVALEATLASYLEGRVGELPVLAALAAPAGAVRVRVERWASELARAGVVVAVVPVEAATGGGVLAETPLGSWALALAGDDVEGLAARLRRQRPAVVGRVHAGRLLLDGRTVLPGEDGELVAAVLSARAP